jgi:hypothetical protein
MFVHGVVREDEELRCVAAAGISLSPFEQVLHDLCPDERGAYTFAPAI